MASKRKSEKSTGFIILLVDDNRDYLETIKMVLENEGHTVMPARGGEEALKILKSYTIDLVLLDYFMPRMTGEQVINEMRNINKQVQIILQTGYAADNPPGELLNKLDIQGYYDKSEGIDKLLLWVDVGLKAAYTVQLLNKSRMGLNYILDVTPELHKIQPLTDLLQGILWQISGLLGSGNSFLTVMPKYDSTQNPNTAHESFLAMFKDEPSLQIHAGIGKFSGKTMLENALDSGLIESIYFALKGGTVTVRNKNTIIPLKVGSSPIGVIFLDGESKSEDDIELLNIFANQAAVAIQNAQLYEMATQDPLTGVYVRRFFSQWLLKELHNSLRSKQEMSLIMIDLDNLKTINDSAGHLAGDKALAIVGKILQKAVRTSDFIGRYGGDEFAIILPQTSIEGAVRVSERILSMINSEKLTDRGETINLQASIGVCSLAWNDQISGEIAYPVSSSYFSAMARHIMKSADSMLYKAKKEGKNCYRCSESLTWLPYLKTIREYESENGPVL